MKTIIAGSRYITSYRLLQVVVASCPWEITEVVCGGAKGVDSLGKKYAAAKGLPVALYPADWQRFGNAAGPIRNGEMAEYADALILLWDGNSRGSLDMRSQMIGLDKPVHEAVFYMILQNYEPNS